MHLLSWIILSVILSGDILVVIAEYHSDRAKNERKLSSYTPDQLIKELNEDFNDPKILW